MKPDVIVIGAGLAGLCCARRLQEHGLAPLVLEGSDGVGGRVRTDRVDGLAQLERPIRVRGTLYACGDYLDTSSIEGAMRSGQRAADELAYDLKQSRTGKELPNGSRRQQVRG